MGWFDRNFRTINFVASLLLVSEIGQSLFRGVQRRTQLLYLGLLAANITVGFFYPHVVLRYEKRRRSHPAQPPLTPHRVARWVPYVLSACLASGTLLILLTYIVWNGSWLPLLLGLGLYGISTAVVTTQWR